jgi:hypothetical protein
MTPEGRVKKDIKAWLDARGFWRAGNERRPPDVRGWYYMPVPMGMGVSGIPDFMGVVRRKLGAVPFSIEAKAPGNKPTPQQSDRHMEIRAAGGFVLVIDDVSQLAEWESYFGREIPGTGSPA